jgi:hypothetical protein
LFEIENWGNKELANFFFALQLRIRHYLKADGLSDDEFNKDPRNNIEKQYLSRARDSFEGNRNLYLEMLFKGREMFPMYNIYRVFGIGEDKKYELALLGFLKQEITRRGFDTKDYDWYFNMTNNPTYIREITATNIPGEQYIDLSHPNSLHDSLIMFDCPVRKACKILNEKGYVTYWSSANSADFEDALEYKNPEINVIRGEGSVIKDKRVAYILIDPCNLSDELKQQLFLNGRCNFWGIALNHADNGKYYGIWAEITSLDMKCDDLSKILTEKALALPELEIEKVSKKR